MPETYPRLTREAVGGDSGLAGQLPSLAGPATHLGRTKLHSPSPAEMAD